MTCKKMKKATYEKNSNKIHYQKHNKQMYDTTISYTE